MAILRRIDDVVMVNNECFMIGDVISIMPNYDKKKYKIHYYDGKKHYVSDGMNQFGCELPYPIGEEIIHRLVELKMCRSQREIDHRHIENLRNGRK